MGAPTVTSAEVSISAATLHMDVDTWEMLVRCRIPETDVTLPAGRWQVTLIVGSTRPDVAATPLVVQVDETIASPGTVTIPEQTWRTHRPFDGAATIQAVLAIDERVGSDWVRHTATSVLSIPVAQAPATLPGKRWGAHINSWLSTSETAADQVKWLDMLEDAGCDTIRVNTKWTHLQPTTESTFGTEADDLDTFMDDCASRGLSVIAIVGALDPPAWGGTLGEPDVELLEQFVGEYLTRWPNVWGIEPSNEPDLNEITAAQYAAAHSAVFDAVQAFNLAESKTVKVALGGLAMANRDYLSDVLDIGVTGFDAVSHHPYNVRFDPDPDRWADPARPWPEDATLEDTENALVTGCYMIDEELRGRGLTKPQWITEYGFSNALREAVVALRLTENEAAAYLTTGMRQAARIPMLDVFCVHSTHDEADTVTAWYQPFGLAAKSGRLKPQHTAFVSTLAEF